VACRVGIPPRAWPGHRRRDGQREDRSRSPTTELKRLGELHTSGILTDEEFTAAKAKILNI
jgi:hypothetical protein